MVKEVLKMGRKHRKAESASYNQLLLFLQCLQQIFIVWNRVKTLYNQLFTFYVHFNSTTQSLLLTTLEKEPFENIMGKGENTGNKHFLLFP